MDQSGLSSTIFLASSKASVCGEKHEQQIYLETGIAFGPMVVGVAVKLEIFLIAGCLLIEEARIKPRFFLRYKIWIFLSS